MKHDPVQLIEVAKQLASFQETIRMMFQVDLGGFGFITNNLISLSGPVGRKTNYLLGFQIPEGIGLGWAVVRKAKPWKLTDYLSSTDIRHENYIDSVVSLEGIKSSFGTPLYYENSIVGIVYAWNRGNKEFSKKQLSQMITFGETISKNSKIGLLLAHNQAHVKELIRYIDFYMGADIELLFSCDDILESALDSNMAQGPLEKLAGLLNCPVILIDKQLHIRLSINTNIAESSIMVLDFEKSSTSYFNSLGLISLKDVNGNNWLATPVKLDSEVIGYVCFMLEEPVSFKQIRFLKAGCMALTMLERQEKIKLETQQHLRGELIEQLLTKTWHSEQSILTISARVGLNLKSHHTFLVISGYCMESLRSMYNILQSKRYFNEKDTLMGIIENHLIFLFPEKNREDLNNLINDISKTLDLYYQGKQKNIIIVALCQNIEDYSSKYKEICCLLECLPDSAFRNQVIDFDELGPQRIFLNNHNQPLLINYVKDILDALLEYDYTKGTALVGTLQCYFDNKCSRKETAKNLFIHEHTLDYRLRKIQELIGINLSDPSRRFNIHFALEAFKIMRTVGLMQ